MPYCPNDECPSYVATRSRPEFVDGVARCSDCDSPLVAQALPPPAEEQPWRWVLLERFNTPAEAHLVRSLLESEGIPVQIADDHFNEIYPLLAPVLGWLRLQVPAELEQQARALLRQDESAAVDDIVRSAPASFSRADALGDSPRRRVRRRSVPVWLWLLWLVMLGIAFRMALWRGE